MPGSSGDGGLGCLTLQSTLKAATPSISLGVSRARGRGMMVCGTLFSSQICLKVAATPSAFPIRATTHWRAGGLPPARPALWTGTAPPRYRAPDSPQSPSTVFPLSPPLCPGKKPHHHCPTQGLHGTNCQYNKWSPVSPRVHSMKRAGGSQQALWSQHGPCNQYTSRVTNPQHHSVKHTPPYPVCQGM